MNLDSTVIVVSGLPRSGTSLMMQLLAAMGVPLLTDNLRTADESNPQGYQEYDRVKFLAADNDWLQLAKGKATKVIVQLLPFLPAGFDYKILFVRRDVHEVMKSQNQMLRRLNSDVVVNQDMAAILERIYDAGLLFAGNHPQTQFIEFEHRSLLSFPLENANRIEQFIGCGELNTEAAPGVIKQELYRSRV